MKNKKLVIKYGERVAFKGWIAFGAFLTLIGGIIPVIQPSAKWGLLLLLIGTVVIAHRLSTMRDRIWAQETAREAMSMKQDEEKMRENWNSYSVERLEFRNLSGIKKTVVLMLWLVTFGCLLWAGATAIGIEATKPSQAYIDIYLKGDPTKIFVDRLFVSFVFLGSGLLAGLGAMIVFREKWTPRPDDGGWADIVFGRGKEGRII